MRWFSIIRGALLPLLLMGALAGCSAVRLGYNNAPSLLYYWLDGYADFDDAQTTAVRSHLQSLHEWHRKDELPRIADLLKTLQGLADQEVSPDTLCRLYAPLQERIQAPAMRVTEAVASVAATVTPAQLSHMQATFDKRNREWREEWLDMPLDQRIERRMARVQEQAEMLYGRLAPPQIAQLRTLLEASAYDPQRQYTEMLRRQRDSLAVLTLLRSRALAPEQARAEVQGLIERSMESPDMQHRRYMQHMRYFACSSAATLHNSASAAQRDKMRKTLQGYEADARALIANP